MKLVTENPLYVNSSNLKTNLFNLVQCDPSDTCSGHGTCEEDGSCKCSDGFYGDSCSSKYLYYLGSWSENVSKRFHSFKKKFFFIFFQSFFGGKILNKN